MYIIAGLGNPGGKYENTRHNVGFEVIDILADRMGICVDEKKHRALCGKGVLEGEKVILVKPQTFMNLSGESVRSAADYYKVETDHIIVVFDDISLEPGQLRIRGKGSAGGHNGIKNIIAHLGTQEFPRVKVGIGEKPRGMDLADYVLSHFSKGEKEAMEEAYKEAAAAVAVMVGQGMDEAMNRFNGKKKTE
jgi:PTH1 family peptidyl-tRNA hydrolase